MTTENLLLRERHALILQRLSEQGRVLAPDLAQQLNVSEDTVRRDLRDLAAAGLCQKVYGGALALPGAPETGTLMQRTSQQVAAKSALAQAAVRLLTPGQVVFIDAGSTNLAIAAALPEMRLTVVTNAPLIAAQLLERPQIELIVIGGRVDPRSGAAVGASALRAVALLRPDLYMLGGCGVDGQAGITVFHYEEAEFKRSVAANSGAVLVAATADKLGTAAPYAVLPAAQLTHLVVEHHASVASTDVFAALGVRILRANAR
jgi:DeoR/GlpR family transcriptional regulator of sugar metabolism